MTTTNTLFKSETVFGICLECNTRADTHLNLSPLKEFGTRFIACPSCGKGAVEVITKPAAMWSFEFALECAERDHSLHLNSYNNLTERLDRFKADSVNCKWYQDDLAQLVVRKDQLVKTEERLDMIKALCVLALGE